MFPPLTGCDRLVIRAKVMSTPVYVDSVRNVNQAVDGSQSSEWPCPLLMTPFIVMLAQLVDTNTELDPEESQPLGSRVPLMSEEFEASEPLGTRTVSFHSLVSSDSIAPLSLDHPLTYVSPTLTPTRVSFHRRIAHMTMRAQPAMSLGQSAIVAEAMALLDSAFCKSERDELGDEDTKEDVEDESQGLDDESQGLEDEGLGLEEEEAVPEGQQQAVSVVEIAASEPLGLGYRALRHRELAVGEDQVPSTFEVDQSSRFRSLEREQERATMTFGASWRPVLALEAWAGHVDTRLANMSQARYDDHRLIHDMLVQQPAMQHEL
ncbi:hypothetical protein Tco_0997073 [Tanacetum coccineum]